MVLILKNTGSSWPSRVLTDKGVFMKASTTAKTSIPPGIIHGPLVRCFSRSSTGLRIKPDTGPGEHLVRCDGNIIHTFSKEQISLHRNEVFITASSTAELGGFMRALLMPKLINDEAAFMSGPGRILEKIAERENEPLIDLTDIYGWNFPCCKLEHYGVDMMFVSMGFIPRGLEFISSVWVKASRHPGQSWIKDHDRNQKVEDFYDQVHWTAAKWAESHK